MEAARREFVSARRSCGAVLASITTASHLNLSTGAGFEQHGSRLLALLDSLQLKVSDTELAELRERLQGLVGYDHRTAALALNPSGQIAPFSNLMEMSDG